MTRFCGFAELDRPPLTKDMRCAASNLVSFDHCDMSIARTDAPRRSAALLLRIVLRARSLLSTTPGHLASFPQHVEASDDTGRR